MTQTDAQRRADAAYRKKSVRQVIVKFYPGEAELYEWVKSQPTMAGYLKALAEEDMRSRSEGATADAPSMTNGL